MLRTTCSAYVDAAIAGELHHLRLDVLGRVIEHGIRAVFFRKRKLLVRTRGGEHARTQCLADFDCRQSDTAGRAQYEQTLAGLELCALDECVIRGAVVDEKTRSGGHRHRVGQGNERGRIGDALLCKSALPRDDQHSRTDFDASNVRPDFGHDAGDFIAGREGHFRLDLILAGHHQRVGKTESDGMHANAHLAWLKLRRRNLLDVQLRWRSITT
jgi:hypothetical protein